MSTSWVLLGTAIVCAVLAVSLYQRVANWHTRGLPGPPASMASWIWGHEYITFSHEATEMYSRWTNAYGSLFKIKGALFHPDIIVATDHSAVRHIFADHINYVKSPAFRPPIANLIGKGIVWAEGDEHAMQRKALLPAFTPEAVKGMADVIIDSAERMESTLLNTIRARTNGQGGCTLDMLPFISSCTLDVIGRVGFGHTFTHDEHEAIATGWKQHVNAGLGMTGFLAPLVVRMIPPAVVSAIFENLVGSLKVQSETKRVVGEVAGRLMREKKWERNVEGEERGRDLMTTMLTSKSMSEQQVLDNISTMVMVGHETTAGSLVFTLWAMAKDERVQKKLREEILAVCGPDGEVKYDEVSNPSTMPYLDAVVKEGLRSFPASPQTERVALKDDVIPLTNAVKVLSMVESGKEGKKEDLKEVNRLYIKKGQVFHIPFMTMQTRVDIWGLDAGMFRPERWLKDESGKLGIPDPKDLPHGWSGQVTFCDGPRMCLGYRMALLELKVMLAVLLRKMRFVERPYTPGGSGLKMKISPTMQPVMDGVGGKLELGVCLL